MVNSEKVAREISVLVPKLIAGVRKQFFEVGKLTSRQIVILLFIYDRQRTKITDIAISLSVSLPTITGIVDRLTKRGYLKRNRDEDDRRLVHVSLTKEGRRFVGKFKETVRIRWQKLLTYLSQNEQEFYLKILKKLIRALDEERNA